MSVPRGNGLVAGKIGCALSPNLIIINSATLSHSPRGLSLQVEYHFFSDPSPRNDQRPAGNLFTHFFPKQHLMLGSESPFQDITQNLKIHKLLNARD